jgi:7-cyano-7-deazaguanine reductase
MTTKPSKELETFPNPNPGRDYTIAIRIPEFTCLCPKTGQPDFATLHLRYVPDAKCVELKSLKLYVWSFRDEGHFHEKVTNQILDDLVAAVKPRYMRLRARFNVRGGIYTNVTVEYRMPGYTAEIPKPERRENKATPASGNNAARKESPGASVAAEAAGAPDILAGRTSEASRASISARGPRLDPIAEAAGAPADRAGKTTRVSDLARMIVEGRHVEPDNDDEDEVAARRHKTSSAPEPARSTPQTPSRRKAGSGAPLFIGIDIGTTGCRTVAIGLDGHAVADASAPIATPVARGAEIAQDPALWWKAVREALAGLCGKIDAGRVQALAVDGTSSTVLLCDAKGKAVSPGLMYNDARARDQASLIELHAERECGAHGPSSSLAKLLWFSATDIPKRASHFVHQADWIAGQLTGRFGVSDYNNCLKLGYDAHRLAWPDWMSALDVPRALLPSAVLTPGETIGALAPEIAKTFGLPPDAVVVAGTTDSVAAFVASGASRPGDGVTSLGSTLVLKLLGDKPIFAPEHGVYSHRLGDLWLAGGASNSGGAVLLQYFGAQQMAEMEPLLDPETDSGLEYYPLPGIGERFPINDPQMKSQTEPLPGDSVEFFKGLLEGIARIERDGYTLLHKLGGPALKNVRTVGGGARNLAWRRIRERLLRVPMVEADSDMAAVGVARIAAGLLLPAKAA